MKDIAEGAMEHLDSAKRQVKSSMQSISDCADDAWNKVMGDANRSFRGRNITAGRR